MSKFQFPLKILPSDLYSLVIEDANGVTYFWLRNGTYDGFDIPFIGTEDEETSDDRQASPRTVDRNQLQRTDIPGVC